MAKLYIIRWNWQKPSLFSFESQDWLTKDIGSKGESQDLLGKHSSGPLCFMNSICPVHQKRNTWKRFSETTAVTYSIIHSSQTASSSLTQLFYAPLIKDTSQYTNTSSLAQLELPEDTARTSHCINSSSCHQIHDGHSPHLWSAGTSGTHYHS